MTLMNRYMACCTIRGLYGAKPNQALGVDIAGEFADEVPAPIIAGRSAIPNCCQERIDVAVNYDEVR